MIESFFGLLTPAQWEVLRNWLATAGGLIALLIAANTYRRNVNVKREEQARLVFAKVIDFTDMPTGSWVEKRLPHGAKQGVTPVVKYKTFQKGDGTFEAKLVTFEPAVEVTIAVHNGSKELIGPVRLQLVDGESVVPDPSARIETIDPESEYVVNFVVKNPHAPGFVVLRPTIIFRDASGQWWRRHRAEPIERVHDDPENQGPTAVERVRMRREQRAGGVPDESLIAEPRPALSVRWHRFWRVVRGKSALP